MTNEVMRKGCVAVAAACLMAAPSHAANWQDMVKSDFHNPTAAVRSGAFVGARFVTSFGHQTSSRGQISLAPTHSHIAGNGSIETRIGEGLALNFSAKSKPSLTLAGARADMLLGLNPRGSADGDKKLGMSTGGWVAVRLVTAVVVGFVAFGAYVREKEEGED